MIVANDAFSITPDRLVYFTRFDKMYPTHIRDDYPQTIKKVNHIERSFHNFEISAAAQRNLKNKISWLFHLSRKNDIKTYSGKRIHSFRVAFFTFTLPSKQRHPTSEITKDLFNHLLTVLRQRYKMENYVWRLEFQGNGNVHYHMVTDCYIDYFAVRNIWNKILELKGYVSAYTNKHSGMTLQKYVKAHNKGGKVPFDVLAKRYAKGKGNNWSSPPTVDVKSAVSKARIGIYIAKYFNKKEKSGCLHNPLDNEENSGALRLWFCSRSLSRMKTVSDYLFNCDFDIDYINRQLKKAVRIRSKYAYCIFFDVSEVRGHAREILVKLFKSYAVSTGYVPWSAAP